MRLSGGPSRVRLALVSLRIGTSPASRGISACVYSVGFQFDIDNAVNLCVDMAWHV